ncbi:hypothetical protein [Lactobacillus melliventris]|uniref:Uncharacterized protein n=1 Tax=Lactobacillus melliventris TaxID=1218507 RepID=A0ABX5N618_9LACO|nr:hypothetical protein [Lactobacillus melliventris]PXY86168.1 hypothetical protein DK873_01055 [Lactobacillus melliventris]
MEWYGFTNDEVFVSIMENKKYCKAILQAILPELKIKTIKTIEPQKVLGTKFDHASKDVRLDIAGYR